MKKYYSKKILLLIILMFLILLIPKNVQAVGLQANKGGESLVNTNFQVLFDSIRQMEDEHGTLGTTNDTDNKKNGIDCHMAKNTEWGTASMLSASRYGVVQQGEDTESEFYTTTGNKSGIFQMGSNYREVVATTRLDNANKKYYNYYKSTGSGTVEKTNDKKLYGDAMFFPDCRGWYSASSSFTGFPAIRGNNYKLFEFTVESSLANTTSRAAVVCGSGL